MVFLLAVLLSPILLFFPFFFCFKQYAVSETIGPKLIIIGGMISQLITFCALLIIFIVSYGVAVEVLLSTDQDISLRMISAIFYR